MEKEDELIAVFDQTISLLEGMYVFLTEERLKTPLWKKILVIPELMESIKYYRKSCRIHSKISCISRLKIIYFTERMVLIQTFQNQLKKLHEN